MEVNHRFYFDTQIAVGFAWDNLPNGIWLTFYIPFVIFCFNVLWKSKTFITDYPCRCYQCGWMGTVYDCEPDIDGDGNLGCPECFRMVLIEEM